MVLLIVPLTEYGKYLGIAGLEAVEIADPESLLRRLSSETHGSTVQVVDARYVAGCRHLLFATLGAIHAFSVGSNISQTLAMEILLYVSGQRQIQRAIELVGVGKTSKNVGLVVVSESRPETMRTLSFAHKLIGGRRNPAVIDIRSAAKENLVKERFRIDKKEIQSKMGLNPAQALAEIMIERGALLPARA